MRAPQSNENFHNRLSNNLKQNHPHNSTNQQKQSTNSVQGRLITRKPGATGDIHKRKVVYIPKNNPQFLNTNVLSSLKNGIQQLQEQMVKLNTEKQSKPIMYAKTMPNSNQQSMTSIPYNSYKPQISFSELQSAGYLKPQSKISTPLSKSDSFKNSEFYHQIKSPERPSQKVREIIHLREQLRNKDAVIEQLQRRLQSLKQNYSNQIAQTVKQKIQAQKILNHKIEEISRQKTKLGGENPIIYIKQQQINRLKQELSHSIKEVQTYKLSQLELRKRHEEDKAKLQTEVYSLRAAISQMENQNIKQKGKTTLINEITHKKQFLLKKLEADNQILAEKLKRITQNQVCSKCQQNQFAEAKLLLLTEQNQQLRKSFNSFFCEFKSDAESNQKVLNPELQQEITKKNSQIQILTQKVKYIDTLNAQLHFLDKRMKGTEHLLFQSNQELLRLKLKTLNNFYKK